MGKCRFLFIRISESTNKRIAVAPWSSRNTGDLPGNGPGCRPTCCRMPLPWTSQTTLCEKQGKGKKGWNGLASVAPSGPHRAFAFELLHVSLSLWGAYLCCYWWIFPGRHLLGPVNGHHCRRRKHISWAQKVRAALFRALVNLGSPASLVTEEMQSHSCKILISFPHSQRNVVAMLVCSSISLKRQ